MNTREEDMRLLYMLDLRLGEGMGVVQIARRFGLSKNAVIGALHRVRVAHLPCACTKPENQDGGMPRRWWDA